uniref:Uncharacterized protein n=1 Tax=Callorhinchus milii TaxID=7868 RepID=A0A4W3JW53_CALMI
MGASGVWQGLISAVVHKNCTNLAATFAQWTLACFMSPAPSAMGLSAYLFPLSGTPSWRTFDSHPLPPLRRSVSRHAFMTVPLVIFSPTITNPFSSHPQLGWQTHCFLKASLANSPSRIPRAQH